MSNLQKLAALVGIQDVIPTRDGKEQPVSDETKRALLESVGIEAADEDQAHASLRAIADSSWTRSLPPVHVARRGQGQIVIPVTLAQGTEVVHWTLSREDKGKVSGEAVFKDSEAQARREVEGRSLERRSLSLPDDLPDGYHDLRLEGDPALCRVIVTPGKCWLPKPEQEEGRLWGLAAQIYLLRSQSNWGIGDYTDLRRLVELAKLEGADIVGVNPLHAMFLDKPGDASPYSPSDRLLLNVLNIDINEIPELAFSEQAQSLIASEDFHANLQKARTAPLVDHEAVAKLKLPILKLLFATFTTKGHAQWNEDFERFHSGNQDVLNRSCLFQALRMYLAENDPAFAATQIWPERLSNANASGVEEFARQHSELIRFQLWLQWTADRQLRKVREAAAGMKVGLYRDLAVGSHPSGAEAWTHPDLFARGVQIGAPPDQFNPAGQNWGLPPLNPQAVRLNAYAAFVDLLRTNMRHAGALRIDHVMALRRLYWIPSQGETKDGAYVFYPLDDLVGIIALESQRSNCLVIGEDLGGVPDGFRERMAEANILSYRVLAFERDEGAFHAPKDYPYLSLSVAGNHDLATLSGWWSGADIELRERLQQFPEADGPQEARDMRVRDRAALIEAFRRQRLLGDETEITSADFSRAAHEFLARTQSLLTIVQLDDLTRESEQVNVPGTSSENPNWRRKLSRSLEELETDPDFKSLSSLMQSEVTQA